MSRAWVLLVAVGAGLLLTSGPGPIPTRWAELITLHPKAQRRFVALFQRIEQATGGQIVITSTWRPADATSYHYFGLAVDFNLILPSGEWLRMEDAKAKWEASGAPAIIRAMGFRWGGDFRTTPYDPVHADLGTRFSIALLRARALQLAGSLPLAHFDGRTVPLT